MERLDKFLCDSGAGTRSQVKAILKAGRVAVDGKVEKDNGKKVDPSKQVITLDGEILGGETGRVMIPAGKEASYVLTAAGPVPKDTKTFEVNAFSIAEY